MQNNALRISDECSFRVYRKRDFCLFFFAFPFVASILQIRYALQPYGLSFAVQWAMKTQNGKYFLKKHNLPFNPLQKRRPPVTGSGVHVFTENADVYYGQFRNSKRHGSGTYYSPEHGLRYDGQWAADARHGTGMLTVERPRRLAVRSEVGERQGQQGQEQEQDEEQMMEQVFCYDGDWFNDVRHGFGRLISVREKYSGTWLQNKYHGHGSYVNVSGSVVYDGDFQNGRYHGMGKLTVALSPQEVARERRRLLKREQNMINALDGCDADATINDNVEQQRGGGANKPSAGILFQQEAMAEHLLPKDYASRVEVLQNYRYLGEFQDGKKHGEGQLSSENQLYIGTWHSDMRRGQGKMMYNVVASNKIANESRARGRRARTSTSATTTTSTEDVSSPKRNSTSSPKSSSVHRPEQRPPDEQAGGVVAASEIRGNVPSLEYEGQWLDNFREGLGTWTFQHLGQHISLETLWKRDGFSRKSVRIVMTVSTSASEEKKTSSSSTSAGGLSPGVNPDDDNKIVYKYEGDVDVCRLAVPGRNGDDGTSLQLEKDGNMLHTLEMLPVSPVSPMSSASPPPSSDPRSATNDRSASSKNSNGHDGRTVVGAHTDALAFLDPERQSYGLHLEQGGVVEEQEEELSTILTGDEEKALYRSVGGCCKVQTVERASATVSMQVETILFPISLNEMRLRPHGPGVYRKQQGTKTEVYKGTFAEGKRHGVGRVMLSIDGGIVEDYEGIFLNGIRVEDDGADRPLS